MSHHESQAKGADGRMVDRMLFFSDAVFAIVLTIMVLELHAPEVPHGLSGAEAAAALWRGIGEMWRMIFAYLISFLLVGRWWTIHMRVTRALRSFDWPTSAANLLFLLSVSVIPFAASVLGEGISNPAAWEIYWGVNALSSATLTVMMFLVSRDGGRLLGGMSGRERIARLLQAAGPGIGFAVGVWLAAIGELQMSMFCWVIMIPFMLVARFIYRQPKPEVAADAS